MSKLLHFEGNTMDEARRRAQKQLGSDLDTTKIVRHGKEFYGGLYGFFQRQRFVIDVEIPESFATPPGRLEHLLDQNQDTVRVAALNQELATGNQITNEFDRELENVMADAQAAFATSAIPSLEAMPSLHRHDDGQSHDPQTDHPWPDDPHADRPQADVSTDKTSPAADAPPATTERGDPLSVRLARGGLKSEYLPDPESTQSAVALALRLDTIISAPIMPTHPGDVLILVGTLSEAARVAASIASSLDEEESVLVVSHRRLPASSSHTRARTPYEAGTLIVERRLEGVPSVVLLDQECRHDFVAKVVAAIRPEAICGVLPASWHKDQVLALEADVGHLDALALYDLLGTDCPAQLVGADWPLAYIDGWQATQLSIAARLIEAVEARR